MARWRPSNVFHTMPNRQKEQTLPKILSSYLIYSIFIEYRTIFAFVLLPCLPGREAAAISTQPTVRVWLDKITRMGDPGRRKWHVMFLLSKVVRGQNCM